MTASLSIFEAMTSNVSQLHFEATLTGSDGQPVTGEDVIFRVEGDGSFSSKLDSKEVARETNAEGRARVTWYRRSIFNRDVKATLSAAPAREGLEVSLQQLGQDAVNLGPRTSWTPQPPLGRR
jgi:hypothetical protein